MEWISVKERISDYGKFVLVYNGKFISIGYSWQFPNTAPPSFGFRYRDRDSVRVEEFANDITHWMPLPERPKNETEG